MNNIDINALLRPNIRTLVPYSSARSEYSGSGTVYLDANENSLGSVLDGDYHRYPDPLQQKLKDRISAIKNADSNTIFLGNGSDEPIDLIIRSFCEPGKDNVIAFPPTYGMYEVSAQINDVAIREVLLTKDFQLQVNEALKAVDERTKIIFICSPNNPTGNVMSREDIIQLLNHFKGLVVLDEAYIDFAPGSSLLPELSKYPNLIILQTFSKAWGLAGLRLGMAFASQEIIAVLNKVKAPYNINLATQSLALEALNETALTTERTKLLIAERNDLEIKIKEFAFIEKAYKSDANFILVKVKDANKLYSYLREKGIIVRNRTNVPLCENCLRITVGTAEENTTLLNALKEYTNG